MEYVVAISGIWAIVAILALIVILLLSGNRPPNIDED